MKKVNGIRIFFILTVLFGIGCYQILNFQDTEGPLRAEATEQTEIKEIETETEEEKTVPVSQVIEYKFIIVEEEDYLTVYYSDKATVYEHTDIQYSALEDSLRQKIRKGYGIRDEAALFEFLENYSS